MKLINKFTIILFSVCFLFSCDTVIETPDNSEIINSGSGKIQIEEKKENEFLGAGYNRKSNGIYYFDDKVKHADRDTFILLNEPIWSEYGRDKENAFGFGNFLKNSDVNTFEVLSFRYAKDKNNVYCFGEELIGADSKSFKNTDFMDTYAIDKNNVYFNCNIMKSVDVGSFEVLKGGEGIAKDKNNLFCGSEKINGVDVDSYILYYIESMKGARLTAYSKDKNHVYYSCSHIIDGADSESFEIINPFFAKDKNFVYRYNQVIEGIDPNNFDIEELEKLYK